MAISAPRLGIIAGGGSAPRRVIDACIAQGRSYFVICLDGQTDKDMVQDAPHVWLPLGAFGKLRDLVTAENIGEMVMIGRVRRPSWSELKPDWLAVKVLTKIGFGMLGDDALLRSIGQAMESELHIRMIGVQDILGGALMREGILGTVKVDEDAGHDIAKGIEVVRALGQADIGQAVVIQQGMVLGVEAIEGTDALIARCKNLQREGKGGVLVKLAKPQQDNRFDLPTIGTDTVLAVATAGLRGIAVEAERSLIIDRDKVREIADEKGIFVVGIR